MRRVGVIAILWMLLALVGVVHATIPEGFRLVKDRGTFARLLRGSAKSTKSRVSHFVQTKHPKMLSRPMQSEGDFYYRQPGDIRLEYTKPVAYHMVICNGQLFTGGRGGGAVVDLTSNSTMRGIRDLLAACMSGQVWDLASDYQIELYESDALYRVVIVPTNSVVRGYIAGIEIEITKFDAGVTRLVLRESTEDFTEYLFSNRRNNVELSPSLFRIG